MQQTVLSKKCVCRICEKCVFVAEKDGILCLACRMGLCTLKN